MRDDCSRVRVAEGRRSRGQPSKGGQPPRYLPLGTLLLLGACAHGQRGDATVMLRSSPPSTEFAAETLPARDLKVTQSLEERRLDEARSAFDALEFDASLEFLKRFWRTLERGPLDAADLALAHRGLLLEAQNLFALEEADQAMARLQDAACLQPQAYLDPTHTPPPLLRHYYQARSEVMATESSTQIRLEGPTELRARIDGDTHARLPQSWRLCGSRHYLVLMSQPEIRLQLDGTGTSLRQLKLDLRLPPKTDTRRSGAIWRSPWLWSAVGVVVLAASITLPLVLRDDSPAPALVLPPAP